MTRLSVDHRATAARLREQPGEWQTVGVYSTPTSARITANLIRTGGWGIGTHYRPAGSFETRTRADGGGAVVEARYVSAALLERQHAARIFLDARDHTASPSEQIAYALDAQLVLHPEPLATSADAYPDWTPGGGR